MERLRLKKDFEAVFKKGKRFFPPFGTFFIAPNAHHSTRVGIIVGTKVAKKAVVRNRLRRRVREAMRLVLMEQTIGASRDIVILPKITVLGAPFEKLKQELARVMNH